MILFVFVSMFLNPVPACDTFQDVKLNIEIIDLAIFQIFSIIVFSKKNDTDPKNKRRNRKFEKWPSRLFLCLISRPEKCHTLVLDSKNCPNSTFKSKE